MSGCGPHDPGVETLTPGRGSALPFLPTLATALAVAGLSLLCRAPTAPAPVAPIATARAAPAGADGFHPALVSETAPAIPAALAFARLHPLTLHTPQFADADEPAKAPAVRPARPAVAARRACAAPRCGEARRVDTAIRTPPAPVRSASEPAAVPEPMRGQAEADEGLLPTGAIPFAATAVFWVEKARKLGSGVGSEAASLGGSVVDLIASAR
ncbi:hypothetical protein [Methylobacterium thuringiense]|uniref:Uncharacterized protein n=1 Tax=Methylobacterium thuringiense TaxID=1003091 RepID=A0ABQ4TLK5_9HYPH|nr:hypothetical protein [Methylobacterium thuringiense]GJE55452.1 hypothetical protein EKPJFOCH_1943 [Methylobacterium thuringiense]